MLNGWQVTLNLSNDILKYHEWRALPYINFVSERDGICHGCYSHGPIADASVKERQ